MFSKLLPKEYGFFELFNRHAKTTLDGCRQLQLAVSEWPKEGEARVRHIKELEHECDSITHMTVDLLHRTFITPLDRDEILDLISKMDDVMDCVDTACSRIARFKLERVPDKLIEMAKVLSQAMELVAKSVEMLRGFKHVDEMRCLFKEVHRLEGEGDELVHAGVAALFDDHAGNPLMVIKLKEIYEIVERGIDEAEDVANIIEGIALEHS